MGGGGGGGALHPSVKFLDNISGVGADVHYEPDLIAYSHSSCASAMLGTDRFNKCTLIKGQA